MIYQGGHRIRDMDNPKTHQVANYIVIVSNYNLFSNSSYSQLLLHLYSYFH